MANEVRTLLEGELRWVQASGSGRTWATAASPASGIVGLCAGVTITSGQTVTVIMNRGVPDHNKVTEKAAIDLSFDMMWTGNYAIPTASGGGASVPMFHYELRASAAEIGATSAFYYQFHGCPIASLDIKEAKEGDTISFKTKALAMNGPTASGYLS